MKKNEINVVTNLRQPLVPQSRQQPLSTNPVLLHLTGREKRDQLLEALPLLHKPTNQNHDI